MTSLESPHTRVEEQQPQCEAEKKSALTIYTNRCGRASTNHGGIKIIWRMKYDLKGEDRKCGKDIRWCKTCWVK